MFILVLCVFLNEMQKYEIFGKKPVKIKIYPFTRSRGRHSAMLKQLRRAFRQSLECTRKRKILLLLHKGHVFERKKSARVIEKNLLVQGGDISFRFTMFRQGSAKACRNSLRNVFFY